MDYSILLVDDEPEICRSLSEILDAKGYSTRSTSNPLDVPGLLEQQQFDLIIMDIKMPQMGGIDLLKSIKRQHRSIPVLMITGYPSVEDTVLAMKYGAVNVYTKPLKPSKMLKEIHELASTASLKNMKRGGANYRIITENAAMKKILGSIGKAARTTAPVLITGESGTGKELVAHSLHHLSPRKQCPFIKVNCAALPDELLESELFGHEKGAFSGAVKERKGRFELADKGTIFLDEIGDMSLKTQAKILRVIQEQKFERVGGTRTIGTDSRIVAATNKEISHLIADEQFREDLYYRLSVIPIHLPPLRERQDDILPLAEHFVAHYNGVYQKEIRELSKKLRWFFGSHSWPGNVRELKNCIERAVIFCESQTLDVDDLAAQYGALLGNQMSKNYDQALESLNREAILDALQKSKGVKTKAADLLKVSRKTLYNRIKKFGLE